MEGHDPTVTQAWLTAIPAVLTAISTWYLRRGTKKSHATTEANTTEKLDSYNGAIKDEIEALKAKITELESTVTKSRDCQILLAQKYTDNVNALQGDLQAAKRALERRLASDGVSSQTQAVDEAKPETPGGAESPASASSKFGEVKIVESTKAPLGKVKWEKGE